MSAPAFSLHRVAKFEDGRTGPVQVLCDVTLDVAPGQFVTVVGPSGCGKSTLADLLAGRTEPSAGRLLADGRPLSGPGADRALVGRRHALLPWHTVAGNVAFGLEGSGLSAERRAAAVAGALSLLRLTALADRKPSELDEADLVRAALARAVARDPGALILDEPFDALDPVARVALQEDLLRVWRETGMTVVFMTHSADEAIYLGQRVAVLTPRPASVKTVIDIDLGVGVGAGAGVGASAGASVGAGAAYVGNAESADLRTATRFAAYRNRVWDELYNAAHPHGGDDADRLRLPVGVC